MRRYSSAHRSRHAQLAQLRIVDRDPSHGIAIDVCHRHRERLAKELQTALTPPGDALNGNGLDWFRFWLQNYEDPAPDKTAQYERWRLLRKQRDAQRQ